ncbi:hypothetical protein C8J57DRAFT_1668647 [Mycena rebaudengoi]|nr:hypothetical protein C8J57DRAFT_1668647 [Mycena rebaudengoi]
MDVRASFKRALSIRRRTGKKKEEITGVAHDLLYELAATMERNETARKPQSAQASRKARVDKSERAMPARMKTNETKRNAHAACAGRMRVPRHIRAKKQEENGRLRRHWTLGQERNVKKGMKTEETGEKQEKHHKHEGKKRRKEKGESKYERDEICRKYIDCGRSRRAVAWRLHAICGPHANTRMPAPLHTRNAGQKISKQEQTVWGTGTWRDRASLSLANEKLGLNEEKR